MTDLPTLKSLQMDDAAKYLLRQCIAGKLDYPSVYMGGPSLGSALRAIAIIEAISVDFEITPRAALQPNIEQVKTWRTSPWDSLERT
jgi:hypothetical protein